MISGILNIYKEKGYTSHDVVARLRGITGQKKIGHTGTLDPEAEGVLPVCLGRATKLCDMLTDRDKTYETVLLLGKETDTQDATGRVLRETSAEHLKEEDVAACILGFQGEYDQIPPMYSALKVNGQKLCDLARQGKTVERKSRRVVIYQIRLTEISLPRVHMEVTCSKGTYIRTLCHDIGEKLGVGGCMESLVRTRAGMFRLDGSIRLCEAERLMRENRLEEVLLPTDRVFETYRAVHVSGRACALAYNGNPFTWDSPEYTGNQGQIRGGTGTGQTDELCRVYDPEGRFIGIYHFDGKDGYRIEKMFLDPDERKTGAV